MRVGDLIIKLAGRDAGKRGVILKLNKNNALVDGEVRRREVNLSHLEPLNKTLSVNENASHEEVLEAFKLDLGMEIKESKSKESKPRPKRVHKAKQKPVKASKVAKPKAEKKAKSE